MPAEITSIAPDSPAARTKIAPGDVLLSINNHAIGDVLDYRFYAAEQKLRLVLRRNKKNYTAKIRKDEYEDPGLEFADGLMNAQRRCKNKCVFCFIDQLPPGLRESLYFKDDDARLGFLFGNYITLTNLTDREVTRMIAMRLSPVNVSIHTMNPELRCKMMGNPMAGECLAYLEKFAKAGIDLNIQLVLCPGWNDGEALRFTLKKLLQLPTVRSIAAVPVGLTKYRENLTHLRAFSKEEAQSVIDIFDEWHVARAERRAAQDAIRAAIDRGEITDFIGITLPDRDIELYPSDEFFLLAERDMPGVTYYGEFRQLENGVGLWTGFRQDVLDALNNCQLSTVNCQLTIATGVAAEALLRFLVDECEKIWHNMHVRVLPIENRFFGENITVAGLLTGRDVVEQLRGEALGERLLLPAAMFNRDGLTLDGMTIAEIEGALGVPVVVVKNDAEEFLGAIGLT
ncbi:MAG: DUF512 domain-containing protein [Oscillospiraceae bacterium]|nr:DUF512 domain-containing protein [Oscillospiraceae bacterium]